MLVVKKEVKTFYTICISENEFINLAKDYIHSMEKHRYSRAFDFLTTQDPSDEELKNFYQKWVVSSNGDTCKYIADYFNFDGWDNAGYVKNNVLRMVMFNWGGEQI